MPWTRLPVQSKRLCVPSGRKGTLTGWRTQEELVGVQRGGRVEEKVYMTVRPAVIGGLLWIGEVPEQATEDDLRQAMGLLDDTATIMSVSMSKDEAHGRTRGWAVVRFRSDEEASGVLLRSRSHIIATSRLPWPLIIDAMAPKEHHGRSFLLTLQTEGTGLRSGLYHPPHFVSKSTLEFDLCKEWNQLDIFHCAQRDALREQCWKERHKGIATVRPKSEKKKWRLGKQEYLCARSRLRRSLFVKGLDKNVTKEDLRQMFEEFGDVQRCTISVYEERRPKAHKPAEQRARATVRFREEADAMKAMENFRNRLRPHWETITVRHMVENATLLVYGFDPKVTNEMLKDAFLQFGHIRRAQVAVAKDWGHKNCGSSGRGFIEFEKHSVASDVLATLTCDMFCMPYGASCRAARTCAAAAWLPCGLAAGAYKAAVHTLRLYVTR
jgi:hypothetical protein